MDREGKRVYRKIISTSGSSNVKERDLSVGENSVQRGWRSSGSTLQLLASSVATGSKVGVSRIIYALVFEGKGGAQ